LIGKRIEGCPVAYLVGRKEFYSLELEVSPAVLIPRPDTETLVLHALAVAKQYAAPRILDIGTGSGNIPIALAKHLPQAQITTIDRSSAALAVARRNAEKHGVAGRIRFLEGDLFSPLQGVGERFELIVSNPPYIASADLPHLEVGVRQYEPMLALDGGEGGYAVITRLLDQVAPFIAAGGHLVLEIGAPQEAAVRGLIESAPQWRLAPTIRDDAGHPRVLLAQWHDAAK
jgi:release factor glutamine methyltransferase